MITEKGILAKLLAKENVTVQHGNYQTAWFDIKNRTLGLPLWKDMGKDVYDLLIGHEVGHALFTPFEGWHDSPEKLQGCPRSYINVIEDARIERKIRDQYAGLVGPMARGYRKLLEENFFGPVERDDWEDIKLIDKINLKTKLQHLIDVPFSKEEKVFLDRSLTTETFSDVVDLVRDIYNWTKENQEELLSPPPKVEKGEKKEEETNSEEIPQMGHDDQIPQEKEEEAETQENQFEVDESEEESKNPAQLEQEMESNKEESLKEEDYERSETDDNFRNAERSLVEEDEFGDQKIVARSFSKSVAKELTVSFSQIKKERDEAIERNGRRDWYESNRDGFKSYMKESKNSVYYAVKEFEQRKAAFRWTRSQTAKTGSIDVNKLWSYKTNEDIFNRVTRLADAKNHGMIMLIDYSGSMSDVMGGVLDQTIMLSLFCKTVNIPFEVYAFTSEWHPKSSYQHQGLKDGDLHHGNLSLVQIASSKLSKSDFNEALYHMYIRKELYKSNDHESRWMEMDIIGKSEEYGSTPLNEALIVTDYLIKDFKLQNQVDKMNLVIVSDGDSNRSNMYQDYDLKVERSNFNKYGKATLLMNGHRLDLEGFGRKATQDILSHLSKKYNMTNIGFFIAEKNWHFRSKLESAFTQKNPGCSSWDEEQDYLKECSKEYVRNKCVAINDVFGYNEYYLLKKTKKMDAESDEFETKEDATKGQLTTAFKKYSKSKIMNKVLLTKFGRSVA